MTNSKTFTVTETAINNVYTAEQEIVKLKGVNKDNNAAANSHKMSAYGEVIASIAHVKLVKGNLPRASQRRSEVHCLKRQVSKRQPSSVTLRTA